MAEQTLDEKRREMLALRKRYYNGDDTVKPDMYRLAQECADMANAKAKELARKHGVRPKLITPDRILRQGEFLR